VTVRGVEMKTNLIAVAILWLCLLASSAFAERHELVINSKGEGLYTLILNDEFVERADARGEPPARSTRDPINATDIYGWHRPQARAVVRSLEKELGSTAVSMTSYAMPTLTLYLSGNSLARLKNDPRIVAVWPQHRDTMEFSSWSGHYDASEFVPWGKVAIGTDDNLTSGTVIYLIDGAAMIDGTTNAHAENNVTYAPVNSAYFTTYQPSRLNPEHANHVAGILGAGRNGYGN
jgi:hypothetical protein